MPWTAGLAPWYAMHGRHSLPWRETRDPWAVLVSEVMLQQTQVSRVLPYWAHFIERWPEPADFAAVPLADVLRAWQGLGYPRRAVALHDTAALVAASGWPRDEAGLRRLPGVGTYTARALLTLALGEASAPPLDVNIARVAARAAAGVEPGAIGHRELEALIVAGRPRGLDRRAYTFALFDAGALHCRARPQCEQCPLRRACAWRASFRGRAEGVASSHRTAGDIAGEHRATARRRAGPYASSMRRLRGVLLAAALKTNDDLTPLEAQQAADAVAADLPLARDPHAVAAALTSLRADRLLEPEQRPDSLRGHVSERLPVVIVGATVPAGTDAARHPCGSVRATLLRRPWAGSVPWLAPHPAAAGSSAPAGPR